MSKDKTAVVERLKAKILPENRIFVRKNLAISEQVEALRKEKGWTQKELAKKLGKTESEVSRLLSGLHNLTLKSIAKLEAELGGDIIITPLEACKKYKSTESASLKVDLPVKELTEELTAEYAEEPEVAYQKGEKEEKQS
jgi:transcriptional regulator with XRE-family HTH domain